MRWKFHYQKAKEEGLCIRMCGKPAKTGLFSCEECLQSAASYQKKRKEKLKEDGLCAMCTSPAMNGTILCFGCRCGLAIKYREKSNPSRRNNSKFSGVQLDWVI